MLRIIAQSSSAAAKSYYSQADYFTEGQELAGVWGGRGAARLGLSGVAEKGHFDALCDNLHPLTGEQLTVKTREHRRVLYDWNVSVPKSVSLAFELSRDERILDAFRASVDDTMREAEAEMKTRVRLDGQEFDRTTGEMVWTTFVHRTTRPAKEDSLPDPQLHAHCTVFNATWDGVEERWKASQQGDLKRDAPYWQAAFNARMAKRMIDLGYGVERTKDGWQLAGVSKELTRKFSRRTREIETLAADLGITDPSRKDKLGATSRQAKIKATMSDLRSYWNSRLTPEERGQLDAVARRAEEGVPVLSSVTAAEAVRHAIRHCFERDSIVSEKRLVAEALRFGIGSMLPGDARDETTRQNLLTTEFDGQRVATTREVLAQEQRNLAFARSGRGSCVPLKPGHVVARDYLDAGQRRAIAHVLESSDRVMLVRGGAGTGKTKKMQETVGAIQSAGVPVAILAPSAKASRGVLREEGFREANTVASFRNDREWQERTRGGVIWVDEAGLLGTADLAGLFDLAGTLDARVVLVGDTKQHGSVNRGPALKLLETHAGLPKVAITDIKRQSGDYKAAVHLLSTGDTLAGFDKLDAMAWVREVNDEDRVGAVAAEYLRLTDAGQSVRIVSPTHAEGKEIVDSLRQKLKARGVLGEEREFLQLTNANFTEAERADAINYAPDDVLRFHKPAKGIRSGERRAASTFPTLPLADASRFQVFRPGTVALAVGDAIRVTAGGKSQDGKRTVENGDTYTIKGFTPVGDIRLDDDLVLDKDFGFLAPAYVSTSHAAQGATTSHVLVVQSAMSYPASSAEQFYVSVSRGRKSATVFTDCKAELRDAIRRSDKRPSATEVFANAAKPVFNSLAKRVAFVQRIKSVDRANAAAVAPAPRPVREYVSEA